MTTIHQLRTRLETAQAEYLAANIEHPTAVLIAKDALTNARFDYWNACADLVTRLPDTIVSDCLYRDIAPGMTDIYREITGEDI